jgi:hypothetical protein
VTAIARLPFWYEERESDYPHAESSSRQPSPALSHERSVPPRI